MLNLQSLKSIARRFARRLAGSARHIALATFLVLAGVLIAPTRGHLSEEIRQEVSGSLLAVGLVGVLYDYFFVRRAILGSFDLVKTASALELERIYLDRGQALSDIAAELSNATGSVKIKGVSCSDFFGDGPAASALSNIIQYAKNVHVRVLLLASACRASVHRAWIEESYPCSHENQAALDEGDLKPDYSQEDYARSTMQARMASARAALSHMAKRVQKPTQLSARFYCYEPSEFLVVVNGWVYVEFYHHGVDHAYRPDAVMPCMAKRTFVMKFRRGSFTGTTLENGFDRIWRCSRTQRFLPLRAPKADLQSVA